MSAINEKEAERLGLPPVAEFPKELWARSMLPIPADIRAKLNSTAVGAARLAAPAAITWIMKDEVYPPKILRDATWFSPTEAPESDVCFFCDVVIGKDK